MKNIFTSVHFEEVIARICNLTSESPKRWGRMTLPQMLVHCRIQLQLALGEVTVKPQGSSLMKSSFGKWVAFSQLPWPKSSKTPREMDMNKNEYDHSTVDKEKDMLIHYLKLVKQQNSLCSHPFFGKLNRKEWGRLIYKHLDHHLRQFRC